MVKSLFLSIPPAGGKRGQRSAQGGLVAPWRIARRRINGRGNRGMAWFKRVHRSNAPIRSLSKNKPPSATAATIPHRLHFSNKFFTTDGTDEHGFKTPLPWGLARAESQRGKPQPQCLMSKRLEVLQLKALPKMHNFRKLHWKVRGEKILPKMNSDSPTNRDTKLLRVGRSLLTSAANASSPLRGCSGTLASAAIVILSLLASVNGS